MPYYIHFETNRSSHHKNSRKMLATKISEAYNMTNDWITVTSEGRQQSSLRKYAEYTEDDSSVDDYLEDISSYSIL